MQVNLFIAVLKIKFAKAQTLFDSKLAKMSRKKRKNIIGRAMDKGKKHISEQVKKKREAGEVSSTVRRALLFAFSCHFGCRQGCVSPVHCTALTALHFGAGKALCDVQECQANCRLAGAACQQTGA